MELETVIGLEVHVELNTQTKMFCGCRNEFGAEPNSRVCGVCLGLPGSLPVINKKAIEKHLMVSLSLNCTIAPFSRFHRKNYFYPDMTKNFQTSQYDLPLGEQGFLIIKTSCGEKKIRITRIHLEEDAGKSIHCGVDHSITGSDYTLLDYNRAGVPLLEIVSEPDMNSPEEAFLYLTRLKKILQWLQISDCKMEEGSLRCDANISLRPRGEKTLGVKTEIKNMNSFRAVRKALEYEEQRQKELLIQGEEIVQETRGWEEEKNITVSMRGKESAHDYRYFPEPDLVPLTIGEEIINEIKARIPELPESMQERFVRQYGISSYHSEILTSYREMAQFFENTAKILPDAKQISNWIIGDISAYLNENHLQIHQTPLTPSSLAQMIKLIKEGIISGKLAKDLIRELLKHGGDPEKVMKEKGWTQLSSEEELLEIINKVLSDNPDSLEGYLRKGKEGMKNFFVGQVMKATRGKANPTLLKNLLNRELERLKNSGN